MKWLFIVKSRLWTVFLAVAMLTGCASSPVLKQEPQPATFYPPAPLPPRIQYLTTFTGPGSFESQRSAFSKFISGDEPAQSMVQVYGLALFGGRLYAVDSKAARIVVFDLVKREFSMFSGVGGGQMRLPVNITIDGDGTKYVTDTGRKQILRYDTNNKYLGAFGEPGQFKPVDTVIAGERLYVVDIEHHQVQVLDKRTGALMFKFGKAGRNVDELFHPTNIAIGPNGDLFVAETNNYRVQRFSPDGKHVRLYGDIGDGPGKFARPKGIAVDREDRLYVSDAAFQNVQIFAGTGQMLMAFGQPENAAQGLSLPAAVKIDYVSNELFQRYADPNFKIEYVILVASQFAPNKIDVFGFGRMTGVDYSASPMVK